MNEIKLYSEIVLMNDKPSASLLKGDVGIVVEIYGNNEGYEVEFMTKEGRAVAIETLDVSEIRAISTRDMLHIRELEQVA
jgi:hypothetical protein